MMVTASFVALLLCLFATTMDAFSIARITPAPRRIFADGSAASSSSSRRSATLLAARKTLLLEENTQQLKQQHSFDPLDLADITNHDYDVYCKQKRKQMDTSPRQHARSSITNAVSVASTTTTALAVMLASSEKAVAVESVLSTGTMSPENFQPVCPASDGFYRFLQQGALSIVGQENFVDYGPLIAGGLLRVRLELCVVESFFNEAVGPFIRDNGLSWILPLHETVETFLAGGIFALATTFILIGSTKILTVIVTYADFLFGFPARLFGGFTFDRAQGKPVTLDIGFGPFKTRVIGPPEPKEGEDAKRFDLSGATPFDLVVLALSGALRTFGQILGFGREVLEAIDAFVGRYLVLWASGYLLIKFLHFKVFPDFP